MHKNYCYRQHIESLPIGRISHYISVCYIVVLRDTTSKKQAIWLLLVHHLQFNRQRRRRLSHCQILKELQAKSRSLAKASVPLFWMKKCNVRHNWFKVGLRVQLPLIFPSSFDNFCVVFCADPVGNVSWILFPEGRTSELRLRRGVGQAAHTLNNPHVECTGVLLCVIRE